MLKLALDYLKLVHKSLHNDDDGLLEDLDDFWDKMDKETRDLVNDFVKEVFSKEL